MNIIDQKINTLRAITSEFLFIEYYSHSACDMWKILNEYTKFNEDKIVLCPVDEGIEKALDYAIEFLSKKQKEFFNN